MGLQKAQITQIIVCQKMGNLCKNGLKRTGNDGEKVKKY
jgi:hypothetical protein